MADIVLYDKDGAKVTYTGINTVSLNSVSGGSVDFSIGGGGGTVSEYAIRPGDQLERLYFDTHYEFPQKAASETVSILKAEKDGENKLELMWTHIYDGAVHENQLRAEITQGGVLTSVELFDSLFWTRPELDVSGFDTGTVTYVDENLVELIPVVARKKGSFGRFPALPPYLVAPGDTVSVLHFNPLSAASVTTLLPILYEQNHNPGDVEPGFGVSYANLGLGLRIGDLSSVGLGDGYLIYSSQDFTLLFSTIAFDASSIVPGFVVTAPGWQAASYAYQTPITADYSQIPVILTATGIMHMVWAKSPFSVEITGII